MSGLVFAEPQWVHGFWALALFVALLFWLERRGGAALERLVGPALRDRLVQRPSAWRRRLRIALLGLAGACLVLALMRPQWGLRTVATPRVGAEIMVALDVSKSMLASDVAPSRLERAKAEIADLLTYLDGDQVGLIAFAGRASVLSPLTPDFSFLRLVLDAVGPHSVGRGGTRLEEPIRKAVAGFGAAGDASRAILLITDGEDHDSFPVDAAKAAAEAGIKVIAIGFGEEGGSEIQVTDPRTGARQLLRDGDGNPVVSRLDGDLLREVALATGGAYIPAGTGVLDLESIYEQHIARLTRGRLDPRGRTVRDEQYQWAVLLALAFLVSSVAVTGRAGSGAAPAAALAGLLLFAAAPSARAQAPADDPAPPVASFEPTPAPGAAGDAAEPEPETPREVYNQAVIALDLDQVEEAERRLRRARNEARGDGKLRFQATYNLGWAAVARADALETDAPEDALAALYESADWFRDAVSQRPEDEAARHNLEVVLRRALLLADRIAAADDRGLEGALEDLTKRQREMSGRIAEMVESLAGEEDPYAADGLRREFRARATSQRTLLADADGIADRAARELDGIAARAEEERAPEESMRLVQLDGVLQHLHRARERMGQTRRQLRRRQAERGYRRSAAALGALKRAQDQLRDPVSFLDQVIAEAARVNVQTSLLAMEGRLVPGEEEPVQVPAWISAEGLVEEQGELTERTGELHARLRAGLDHAASAEVPPEQAGLFEAVREAEPFVAEGRDALSQAGAALEAGELETAAGAQQRGLLALGEARERFFDLRRLIEAAAGDEARIAAVLGSEREEVRAARAEYLPSLREVQARNLARGERIGRKLEAEIERVDAALEGGGAPDPATGALPDPEALALERERFDLASQLLTLALAGMDGTTRALGEEPRPAGEVAWSDAQRGAQRAVESLEQLRRLFFTLVEQLRELGQRQLALADETVDAGARAAADDVALPEAVAPLLPRQGKLAERAGEISDALVEQSDQSGGVVADASDAEETSRRLRLAAEHVVYARGEMEGAVEELGAEKPEPAAARELQDQALEQIALALALLVPPEERQPQQNPQEQEQQQQQPQQQQQQGGEQEQAQAQEAQPDPAQLLQAVRDREAQRRREQGQRARRSTQTVEKDW